jgi:transcriptional regulator with XRE-family HTH domain
MRKEAAMAIGQRIKQARKANNYSLRKLADQLGVSAMAISKYERDQSTPNSATLLRLAEVLHVKIDFFFRPTKAAFQLQAFRKQVGLGIKSQQAIQMTIQDWVDRYLEVENLFPGEGGFTPLPRYPVHSTKEIEEAALDLRRVWNLGLDPIENLTQLLEDRGILVGMIPDIDHFDACTFNVEGRPVIVTKMLAAGDRQRFNIGHELGHLLLEINSSLEPEHSAHRFVSALLVPATLARYELGSYRMDLSINELYLLKHKYGMSMQAWIHRACDLEIITASTAERLYRTFRSQGWYRTEPGNGYPPESPLRMERLIYRALNEDLISRSMAQELLGRPIQIDVVVRELTQNESNIAVGD